MTLEQRKLLVRQFLERCNRYADDMLADYGRRLEGATGTEILALQDKILHWTAYRAFNEHAIAELASDRIDDWFDGFEIG